jgi:hypothetical protein
MNKQPMTQALDCSTIFHALFTLENEFLGKNNPWTSVNRFQDKLFPLYFKYRNQLSRLKYLKGKAATDWEVLNAFLEASGFDPMFSGPFEGIGVASILDMLVEWIETAESCAILSGTAHYPGFKIKQGGFTEYHTEGLSSPLIRLETRSGDYVWLMMPDYVPDNAFDMTISVFELIQKPLSETFQYESVKIPDVDFDVKPDIDFMVGAGTVDTSERDWYIVQAKQRFKFRMNEQGARAKVATAMVVMRGMARETSYVFNQPFIGWMTQSAVPTLPIAIFYADVDSWKDGGELSSL